MRKAALLVLSQVPWGEKLKVPLPVWCEGTAMLDGLGGAWAPTAACPTRCSCWQAGEAAGWLLGRSWTGKGAAW